MQTKYTVGQNIDSYCGTCKLNLDHTIMVMDGETIAKVRCKCCGRSHKFRTSPDPQKIREQRLAGNAGVEASTQLIWESVIAKAKGKERDYSMASNYRIGDIVNHQIFGKGVVLKLYSNKCGMLFKDRERLMASTNT
jgi:hypothetical protein